MSCPIFSRRPRSTGYARAMAAQPGPSDATGCADADRRTEPAGPQPGLARPADATPTGPAAGRAGPRRGRDRDGRAPGRPAGPGAIPALLRAVVPAGRLPARRPGRVAGEPPGGPDRPDAQHHPRSEE